MDNIFKQYKKIVKDDAKSDYIRILEFVENEDKWILFQDILDNYEKYDLARIAVLKIIEIAIIPQKIKNNFANIISGIIRKDEDYDVKNYALSACENFMEYDFVEQQCINTVLNKVEEIDTRYNAFAAILKIKNSNTKIYILTQLLNDFEFNKTARRHLDELSR